MKNIYLNNYIIKYDNTDIININDIKVEVFETEEDKNYMNNYYLRNIKSLDYEIINTDIPNSNSKYIYMNKVFISLDEESININNIDINFYDSEKIAYYSGFNCINKFIKENNIKEEDYFKINYNFEIIKILVHRHEFKTYEDRNRYYIKNKDNISKEELYDFLLDISGGYQINSYDITGNLLYSSKVIENYERFCFKSLMGYHVNKFKEGDKVKFRYANEKIKGVILGVQKHDINIYESNDPFHFREGYTVGYFIDEDYMMYNDNSEDLYYDEDLELLKD